VSQNVKLNVLILDLNGGTDNMIKDLEWLRNKLMNGTQDTGYTIIVLDSIDCKNLLRNIENRYNAVLNEEVNR